MLSSQDIMQLVQSLIWILPATLQDLPEGSCSVDVSPYYSSVIAGLERIADHLINVGYSIVNPIGSQKQKN